MNYEQWNKALVKGHKWPKSFLLVGCTVLVVLTFVESSITTYISKGWLSFPMD